MGEGLQTKDVVVRWGLGLSCLAIEVAIVVIVIDACVRVIGADQLFFWHPVLLTIGAILFLSHGVRVYTAFAGLSRNKARVVHGLLSGVWVCLSIAGLGIIEQVKQETGKPRYHSVHGRLGLAVIFFSLIQGVAGTLKLFVLFKNNQRFLRWHGRLGTLVYASALTAFLTGVMQKFESSEQNTAITVYVLTFVLALVVLFFDFWVKGADLIPEAGPAPRDSIKLTAQDGRLYLPLNDSDPAQRRRSVNLVDA